MEDLSVDTSHLERKDILVKLGQSATSSTGTAKLHIQLKKFLQKDNPILRYLNQLSQENLKGLYLIIFPGLRYRTERVKTSLANDMFKRFPKAPTRVLAYIIQKGKLPIDTELENIYMNLSQDTNVESIEKDVDMIPEVEINLAKKRKGSKVELTNTSAKKPMRNDNVSDNTAAQFELNSNTGRKFVNFNNICYINSVLNGLLALDKYREKLTEGSCQCKLCKFLVSNEKNATQLRDWAAEFYPTFTYQGQQEDAGEFLSVMIDNCRNLSKLAHFDTQEKHICSVCAKVTKGQEEINQDIKSCQINIDSNFQKENINDMLKRTQPFDKFVLNVRL